MIPPALIGLMFGTTIPADMQALWHAAEVYAHSEFKPEASAEDFVKAEEDFQTALRQIWPVPSHIPDGTPIAIMGMILLVATERQGKAMMQVAAMKAAQQPIGPAPRVDEELVAKYAAAMARTVELEKSLDAVGAELLQAREALAAVDAYWKATGGLVAPPLSVAQHSEAWRKVTSHLAGDRGWIPIESDPPPAWQPVLMTSPGCNVRQVGAICDEGHVHAIALCLRPEDAQSSPPKPTHWWTLPAPMLEKKENADATS